MMMMTAWLYFSDISTLNGPLVHNNFLDEIVFWTVKFEFPQKLVCLLLNMLPDTEYEVSSEVLIFSTCCRYCMFASLLSGKQKVAYTRTYIPVLGLYPHLTPY